MRRLERSFADVLDFVEGDNITVQFNLDETVRVLKAGHMEICELLHMVPDWAYDQMDDLEFDLSELDEDNLDDHTEDVIPSLPGHLHLDPDLGYVVVYPSDPWWEGTDVEELEHWNEEQQCGILPYSISNADADYRLLPFEPLIVDRW